MNSNDNDIEIDRIRTEQVQDRLDALERASENLSEAIGEILKLNDDLRRMRTDPSYHHCLGDETRHYLQLSEELQSAKYEWGTALKFMQECVHLRCNNDRVTQVVAYSGNRAPVDYGRVIGNCLRQNKHVTHIVLHLDTLIGPEKERVDDENVNALRDYIETSPVLRKVSLHRDAAYPAEEPTKTLASKFLKSIGRNHCIEELCYSLLGRHTAFRRLLSKSSSIRTLEVECYETRSYSFPDLLGRDIATSRSISSLVLSQVGRNCGMIHSIIDDMTQSQVPLKKLSIIGGGNVRPTPLRYLPALAGYLQRTMTLEHFEISHYDLDADNIESILEGLRRHYDATYLGTRGLRYYGATRFGSITKLSFHACKFSDQAAAEFVRYMQSPTNGTDGLHELHLQFSYSEQDMPPIFAGVPLGEAMVALITRVTLSDLNGDLPESVPTIGSQLKLLSLDPFSEMKGFLTAMQSQAQHIDLPKLRLLHLDNEECAQLNELLPHMQSSLRELHLHHVRSGVAPEAVLAIYRQCGSLHNASVVDSPFLSDQHNHILEAYCKRNQVLRKMLSRDTLWKWSDSTQQRMTHIRTKKKRRRQPTVLDTNKYDQALLLPLLLQVAKQVPITRGSSMLSTMLDFEGVDGTSTPS